MKRICFELLPFKVHIRDVRRCNFCAMFFLKNFNEMIIVKNATHLFSYQCSNLEVHSLFKKVETSDVYLNIFYKTSDFISQGPKNHNYGEIFADLVNNPFSPYVSCFKFYSRLYFNLLKNVTDVVTFNFFSRESVGKK